MAFGRRILLPALPLLVLLAFSSAAEPQAAAAPAAMHINNWAVLVCTSRFWSATGSNIEDMKEAQLRSHGWTEVLLEQLEGKNADAVVMYGLGTMDHGPHDLCSS